MTEMSISPRLIPGQPHRRTRVAVCWHSVSGYMAACWRALATTPGIDLLVVTQEPGTGGQMPFDKGVLAGVNTVLVPPDALVRDDGMRRPVVEFKPDVLVVGGWFIPACNALVRDRSLASVRKINAIDRPRQNNWRDWYHRFSKGRYMRSFDLVFVTGERSFQYARFLGIEPTRIRRGTYGVDYPALSPLWEERRSRPDGWPRSFLFMGRYEREKGVDVLAEAYRRYRALVAEPWPLATCGRGSLAGVLKGIDGVTDLGFVQPRDQPDLFRRQGVFVMPSRFDPWPLVIVESCAAGLPIICTNACGSAVELVRPLVNGVYAADEDPADLARAMRQMHERERELPAMGRASMEFAASYSAEMWAVRWAAALRDVTEP